MVYLSCSTELDFHVQRCTVLCGHSSFTDVKTNWSYININKVVPPNSQKKKKILWKTTSCNTRMLLMALRYQTCNLSVDTTPKALITACHWPCTVLQFWGALARYSTIPLRKLPQYLLSWSHFRPLNYLAMMKQVLDFSGFGTDSQACVWFFMLFDLMKSKHVCT